MLYCIALYWIVLYCIVLYCIVFYRPVHVAVHAVINSTRHYGENGGHPFIWETTGHLSEVHDLLPGIVLEHTGGLGDQAIVVYCYLWTIKVK